MARPMSLTWIDPMSEDAICQGCSHMADEHVPVQDPDGTVNYPCGAEERFDVDDQGRMVLVDEPCTCEGFEGV